MAKKTESQLALTGILQKILPGQHLCVMSLPLVPDIKLLLFDDADMHRPLDDNESAAVHETAPYWLFCWASGQALAGWLMQNKHAVSGKHVLDFGCGSGVVAIAAAKCGAATVVACDQDPLACMATRSNAELNSVDIEVLQTGGKDAVFDRSFDVILASDILYDSENHSLLDFFPAIGARVIIADSRIKTIPHKDYQLLAELQATTMPDMGELHEFSLVRVFEH